MYDLVYNREFKVLMQSVWAQGMVCEALQGEVLQAL